MKIDRNNRVYMDEFRMRVDGFIDAAVIKHLEGGGSFEAKTAAKKIMDCIQWAQLATDMMAANNLLRQTDGPPIGDTLLEGLKEDGQDGNG